MIQKLYRVAELSSKDKQFSLAIANEFEIDPLIMEAYFKELLFSLKNSFQKKYMIGKIDYDKPMSKKSENYIKYHKHYVIGCIRLWEIRPFRKCIIAAKVLIHLKLDRNIKTKEEYDLNPTDSAQDYNHYLHQRIKNQYKY